MSDKATFTRGGKYAIGLNVLVASLLAPAVAGLLLYLLFRPELRKRLDLTEQQAYSLSDRTLEVLRDLKQEVDVYTCFKPNAVNEAGMYVPGLDAIQATIGTHCNDLLREFEVQARGRLRAHPYDPQATGHFARIDELSRLVGEPAVNMAVVVGKASQRHRVLKLSHLAAYDQGSQTTESFTRPKLIGFRDEEALAQSILSVTEAKAPTIGFLRGHGERDPEATRMSRSGAVSISLLARGLAAQNYSIATIELPAGTPLLPSELEVLVVADPVKPLADHEVATIVRFAQEGGKLLVMLGPASANSLDFALLDQLFRLQRTPHPACQETKVGNWTRAADVFEIDVWSPDHPIVKPLRTKSMRTLWEQTTALKELGRQEQGDVTVWPLAWTTNDAWIDLPDAKGAYNKLFDPSAETRHPLVLACAAERKEGGRAVFLGGASVLDDAHLQLAPPNRDLGLNAVDWLCEREQLIALAPQPYYVTPVELTPDEFNTILLYVVAGVPGLALLIGLAVFWMRRN